MKNSIAMTIRLVVMVLIGLYTSRVVLDILGVVDYGTYNVVAGFVTMFYMFINFFVSSCQRFISYALRKSDPKLLKNVFSTIQIVTIVGAVLLLAIALPLTDFLIEDLLVIPDARWSAARFVFICSVMTMALTVIAQPYIALIIAHEKIGFYSIICIVEYLVKLLGIMSMQYIDYKCDNLKLYALMLLVVAVVVRITYSVYSKHKFEESRFQYIFDKNLLRKVFSFSFWIGCGTVGGIIKDQSGNILLNLFYGVSLNAAKGVAQQIQGVFNQIGNNLTIPISPQITKSYAAGDVNRSVSLTLLLAKVQGYILTAFAIPIILEADFILNLWLKNPPEHASLFVRWTLVLCILQAVSNAYGPLYLAVGRLKKLQILTFCINITLIPVLYITYHFGAPPIAVLYCMTLYQLMIMVLSYWNLSTYVKFPLVKFYLDVAVRLIFIAVITFLLGTFLVHINNEPTFGRLIIDTIITVAMFCSMTYFFGLNVHEREEIKVIYKKERR